MSGKDEIEELRKISKSILAMKIYWEEEAKNKRDDCRTLAQKLLQVKPEIRDWLEVNYGEYL